MNWEQAARELGIPADRQGLVKRNIELKHQIEALSEVAMEMIKAVHRAFDHPLGFEAWVRRRS